MNMNAIRWLRALRSGRYKQGTFALCRVNGKERSYCCLGVACALAERSGVISGKRLKTIKSFDGNILSLPDKVGAWLGLNMRQSIIEKLITLNDDGVPFKEIANYIQKHEKEMFNNE
jgi:hypothetical protein